MQQPHGFWDTTMGMTLMLWLCTLPLWGSWVALVTALVLLVVMLAICRAICNVGLLDEEQKLPKHQRPWV
jgi:hypothetical protein